MTELFCNEYPQTGSYYARIEHDMGFVPKERTRFIGKLLCSQPLLYLSVKVFSTNELIGDTIFTSPTRDGTTILRGHPSHAKV